MLLIYAGKVTNRLGYTLNLIFGEMMGIEYSITTDREYFMAYNGAKFSYCKEMFGNEVFLRCADVLFQTTIEVLDLDYFEHNGVPYIFKTYSQASVCSYDVLAATFYFVSRYEEYLPFIKDEHSRFRAEDSLAYKKGFLQRPVVNIWVEELKEKILSAYPDLPHKSGVFSFLNTIDVDSAFSYIGKGFLRTVGGLCKDFLKGNLALCRRRIGVLLGRDADPYDTFDYIVSTMEKYKVRTVFFVLFGYHGRFDKNISPYNRRFQELVKSLCDYAKVGIHPSYECLEEPEQINEQVKMLKSILHKPIHRSRFHYLRFRLPESYRNLIDNNIERDFSMGYSDEIGFRASICNSFNFYDLALDFETKLRVFPFACMDVALKNGLKLSPQEAFEKVEELVEEVRKVNGMFISVWHNESLSDEMEWKSWREVYEKTMELVSSNGCTH